MDKVFQCQEKKISDKIKALARTDTKRTALERLFLCFMSTTCHAFHKEEMASSAAFLWDVGHFFHAMKRGSQTRQRRQPSSWAPSCPRSSARWGRGRSSRATSWPSPPASACGACPAVTSAGRHGGPRQRRREACAAHSALLMPVSSQLIYRIQNLYNQLKFHFKFKIIIKL